MMLDGPPEHAWRRLRVTRANFPQPGRPLDRATYSSALEQAEQLWRSSAAVDATASPIILYYSLAQGLYAWLHACVQQPTVRGAHGLTLHVDRATPAQPTLADASVKDNGDGLLPRMASELGSPTLPNLTTLAELVCSLPQAHQLVGTGTDPAPLEVFYGPGSSAERHGDAVHAWVRLRPLPPDVDHTSDEALRSWFAPYESEVIPAPLGISVDPYGPMPGDPRGVLATWSLAADASDATAEWQVLGDAAWALFTRVVDVYDRTSSVGHMQGWVRPVLAGNTRPVGLVVTWMAVLFGMSMLARYHPALWTRMLHPDEGLDSERIRHVLDEARDEIPRLLLGLIEHGEVTA